MVIDQSLEVRKIYQKQHEVLVNDKISMERFINSFTNEFFQLPKDYFYGKKVLDAGCGSTGQLIIAISKMGCKNIHGMDLGNDFISTTLESLQNYKIPLTDVTLKSASILNIPYPDNYFDFVSCNGVLQHLNNIDEVKKAVKELARVTKTHLFISFGLAGGLFETSIIPAIRQYYNKNYNFKNFIDQLKPSDFHQIIDFIQAKIKQHEKQDYEKFLVSIKSLIDVDACVTIQNMIQTPLRYVIPESLILNLYKQFGFENPKRLRRYVNRQNYRKFFSPLHYYYKNKFSKMLYGSGYCEYLAKKDYTKVKL